MPASADFTPLPTERLLLRGFEADDLAELAALLADPQVMRYSVRGVMSTAASAEFLEHCRNTLQSQGWGPLAVIERRSGCLAGFCGVSSECFEGVDEVMLGYRFAPGFWGRGLASEAVAAVLERLFVGSGPESVLAVVQPENLASLRVLHKNGFTGFVNARYHGLGVRVYRLRRADWPGRRC